MVEKLRVRYPEFGARVHTAMKHHGITRKMIAKHLKVGIEMARRYEEGRAKPRDDKLSALASLLRFDGPAHLEHGTPTAAAGAMPLFSREALEIARAWEKLSAPVQASVRTMVFAMASAQSVARWLVIEQPKGDGYSAWERAVERAYQTEIKQLELDFKR